MVLLGILKTMRPRQWSKNAFVLAPLVFAKDLFHGQVLLRALVAFLGFSVLAGAVYTINDIVDAEDDRNHPTKCKRPIASGQVPIPVARVSAVAMVVLALGGAFAFDWRVGGVAAAYLALNLAYSLKLKKFAYIDVVCIALGFVLRVVAGCFAASSPDHQVRPSFYLLACTAFLALFLGFGKRRHELSVNSAKARDALKQYGLKTLDFTLVVTALATLGVYLAWTLDPPEQLFSPDQLRIAKQYLWLTTPLVMLGIGRFIFLLRSTHGESPTDAMLKDVTFVSTVFLWGLLVVWILYQLRPAG